DQIRAYLAAQVEVRSAREEVVAALAKAWGLYVGLESSPSMEGRLRKLLLEFDFDRLCEAMQITGVRLHGRWDALRYFYGVLRQWRAERAPARPLTLAEIYPGGIYKDGSPESPGTVRQIILNATAHPWLSACESCSVVVMFDNWRQVVAHCPKCGETVAFASLATVVGGAESDGFAEGYEAGCHTPKADHEHGQCSRCGVCLCERIVRRDDDGKQICDPCHRREFPDRWKEWNG
ncbi:MAG: hypothetical protein Q8S13_14145, partial [Dehalococcoidia bacterium]|nr:hypothetical protein [Dehalococcoidia bacterium]